MCCSRAAPAQLPKPNQDIPVAAGGSNCPVGSYSPSKLSADQPSITFFLKHGRICIYHQAKASRTREGIIPRCVTVRPVLNWRKTTHRLRLSPIGVLRLRGWLLELMQAAYRSMDHAGANLL